MHTATRTPSLINVGRALAVALVAAVIAVASYAVPNVAAVTTQVLCDGRVFDSYTNRPFVMDGGIYADATVLKVIRNCTFRNSAQSAIMVRNARNVLIVGNRFENLRSGVAGVDLSAINIPGAKAANGITIRGNTFRYIGSDGVHVADAGRLVTNLLIEGNAFVGTEDVGENAVDVKGADGPVTIRNNSWSGFRPCQSPKRGGDQDCSGSNGPGITIHDGSISGRARNVTITGNRATNNTFGISVSHADAVTVGGNTFENSQVAHVQFNDVTGCRLGTNTFSGSGADVLLSDTRCTTVSSAPVVATPITSVGTGGPMATTYPVRASWSLSSGSAARYELQASVNGGAYATVALPSASSTSISRWFALGASHQFRVRGVAASGTAGAWAYGRRLTGGIVQQTSSAVRYGGSWLTASSTSYLGGSTAYSRSTGATATATLNGVGVALIADRGPDRGRAAVYVNGTYVATIDLYATTRSPRRLVFARNWGAAATRTVTVRNLGTSGRPTVLVDAFLVLKLAP